MTNPIPISNEPNVIPANDGFTSAVQEWALPLEEAYLAEFIQYVFKNYWDQVNFGPLIEGASYEMTCAHAPTYFDLSNGFLTIACGTQHFHICVGTGGWPVGDTRPARLPGKAVIFRRLDMKGAPLTWGFELVNSAGTPMLTIHFSNPHADLGDKLLKPPRWENLAMWRDIAKRYLGREPEQFDETGDGYQDMMMDAS
jgi:hypothetical protein